MTHCAVTRLVPFHPGESVGCPEPVAHAYERTVSYEGTIDETRTGYTIVDLFLCERHAALRAEHLLGYREVPWDPT
jgi:hypothetical protein